MVIRHTMSINVARTKSYLVSYKIVFLTWYEEESQQKTEKTEYIKNFFFGVSYSTFWFGS